MVQSKATTVKQYLKELPKERREIVSTVRDVILENLPAGYQESMNWGMISYEVPLKTYPDTYNKKPLSYAGLAAQKNHYALYLMCAYVHSKQESFLKDAFAAAGKKLDMGKSCIRFQKLEDLPLEAIAQVVGSTTPQEYIEFYKQSRNK